MLTVKRSKYFFFHFFSHRCLVALFLTSCDYLFFSFLVKILGNYFQSVFAIDKKEFAYNRIRIFSRLWLISVLEFLI